MALNYPEHYQSLVQAINKLCEENVIQPVKSARFDNRNLKLNYKITRSEQSFDDIKMEIMRLTSPIRIDYYLAQTTPSVPPARCIYGSPCSTY
ncbi:MAG TPA: hypothetical protein DDZ89_13865 [Clostridiales bacterium]|nr:hypothetical protein [Clostridiales bacterium]